MTAGLKRSPLIGWGNRAVVGRAPLAVHLQRSTEVAEQQKTGTHWQIMSFVLELSLRALCNQLSLSKPLYALKACLRQHCVCVYERVSEFVRRCTFFASISMICFCMHLIDLSIYG